jgi:hypothetical protein
MITITSDLSGVTNQIPNAIFPENGCVAAKLQQGKAAM